MKELREKLKNQAAIELADMVSDMQKAAKKICGNNAAVHSNKLIRLAVGGRTASLRKRLIGEMIRRAADDLLKQYNDQQELPLGKGKEAAGKGKVA